MLTFCCSLSEALYAKINVKVLVHIYAHCPVKSSATNGR